MKKLLLVFGGLLCSVVIFAQTNFQELSLEKAREQAKTENKPIFGLLYFLVRSVQDDGE